MVYVYLTVTCSTGKLYNFYVLPDQFHHTDTDKPQRVCKALSSNFIRVFAEFCLLYE